MESNLAGKSALEGVAMVDTHGRYALVDEAYRKAFGHRSGELVGLDWKSIIHPKDVAAAVRACQEMQTCGIGELHARTLGRFGFVFSRSFLLVKSFDQRKAFSGHFCFVQSSPDPSRKGLRVQEGEEIFHVALEDSSVGGVLVDPGAGFKRTNKAFQEMLGYTGAELTGMDFADITHPQDFDESAALAYLVLKGALSGFQLKKRILHKTRGALWADLSVRIIRDSEGSPLYAIGLIRDLSESQRPEESVADECEGAWTSARETDQLKEAIVQLHFSADGLLGIFNALPDATALSLLRDGRYALVSEAFLRLCGLRQEEVIGKTAAELGIPGAEPRGQEQPAARRDSLHRIQKAEFDFRTSSGEDRLGLFTTETLDIDNEKYLLTVVHDITEQKRLEKLLRASEARYHAIAEGGWEGICLIDPISKRVLEATQSFFRLVGYSRSEITEFTLYDLIACDREAIDQDVAQVLSNQTVSIGERPFRRKDGSIVNFEVDANVVYDVGTPLVREVVHDVSARKRLEEQLRHAVKMEALGRFAGGIAHDFNNLMVGVLGYSTQLEEKLRQNEPLRKIAHEITSAGLRARELTAQLLSMGRRQVLTAELLEPNVVVRTAEMLLRRIIGEDVELVCELDPDVRLVRANSGQLEQVIMNLSANARDAMPTGGRLTIRTTNVNVDYSLASRTPGLVMGNYVLLSVRDTGCGMDSDTLSHIFEPFFTTKAAGVGTGLGLSTAYGIVRQLGGDITVETQPGKGTNFDIYLPRIEEQSLLFQPAEVKSLPLPVSPTVLTVEDEKTVRLLIEDILKGYGYHVVTAENPERALLLAREHKGPIHLVVTDIVMPSMLGTHLAAELLKLRPNAKILYISGYSDSEIVRSTQLGESPPFLQKPFTPEEFYHKVCEVLNLEPEDEIHRSG